MEWLWVLTTMAILFCFVVIIRVVYIYAYRAGAKRVIAEWKSTLNEGELDDE